jgi:single-strand DNA-binding protein
MAGYNRIIIVGNLTRDPEFKQLPTGQAVCRLSIASNRQFKNRQTGNNMQEVCFVDVDVWGAQAESTRQYLSKGRAVLVEGRLKYDTWQDAQGGTRSKHSIAAERVVFLGSGAQAESAIPDYDQAGAQESTPNYSTQKTEEFMKVEQAVAKKQAARKVASAKKEKEGEMISGTSAEFKDEAPFDDELPF